MGIENNGGAKTPNFLLSSAGGGGAFQRLTFVPAIRKDVAPAPPGVQFIKLNEPTPVSCMPDLTLAQCIYLVIAAVQVMPSAVLPQHGPALPQGGLKSKRELYREEDVLLKWSPSRRAVGALSMFRHLVLSDILSKQREHACICRALDYKISETPVL